MSKSIEKFVTDFIADFQCLFSIQNYEQKIIYRKRDTGDLADIQIREDYQDIKVCIYPKFWKLERPEQCLTLLHELSHALTWNLALIGSNLLEGKLETKEHLRHAEERTTSMIQNILHLLLSGRGKKYQDHYQKYLKG